MIIFGSTTFLAAILALLLPETLGAPLVESLDELFLLHKYAKPLFSWWSLEQANQNIDKINSSRNNVETTRKYSCGNLANTGRN